MPSISLGFSGLVEPLTTASQQIGRERRLSQRDPQARRLPALSQAQTLLVNDQWRLSSQSYTSSIGRLPRHPARCAAGLNGGADGSPDQFLHAADQAVDVDGFGDPAFAP